VRSRLWSLVDPDVAHTQAVCRLRALVLVSTVVVTMAIAGSEGRDRLAASADARTTGGSPARSSPAAPSPTSLNRGTTTTTVGTSMAVAPSPASAPGLPATEPGTVPVLTRIDTTDPVVFITIDDGIVRSAATADALHRLGVPVTLFLVDDPVRVGRSYVSSLPDATVESHTSTHPDLRTLSEGRQRAEICGNVETIDDAFGHRATLFRPPYGNFDDGTRRAAAACGMRAIVLWSVVVDGGSISFRTTPRLRPGDIVLLHFTDDLPSDLQVLAERIEAAGLTVGSLEDYLRV
jgi:peptidoglycan/xylan/chitin deacetylase (PgdA/CDA1 family)